MEKTKMDIPDYHDCFVDQSTEASKPFITRQIFTKVFLMLFSIITVFLALALKSEAAEHIIQLTAEETRDDGFGNKLLAYKMLNHSIDGADVTDRYSSEATIPGPTIILTEGDKVKLTILNSIPDNATPVVGLSKQVSVHVHGVHYNIISDGTLKSINKHFDEGAGAGPVDTFAFYEYEWDIAPGTAGTWPYHDHNFENHNGSENRGLFGTLIVNPIGSQNFAREYVLYLGDDAFWGMEIDGSTKRQSKHGVNPSFSAAKNSDVRFHLLAMGTDLHKFELSGYQWLEPGTNNPISQVPIGPLEKHVFSVKAKKSTQYMDNNFSNRLLGMVGDFNVQ